MVVFNDLHYGEDACYLFEALYRSNSVVCMNYIGYHYVENENSLITREFNLTQLEEMRFADLEKGIAKKWFPACENYVYSYQFIRNIGLLTRMEMKSGGYCLHNEKEECIENIKHAFSKSKKQVIPKGKVLMWKIYRINKKLFRYLAHVYYKYKNHRKISYGY